jgi:hypothetical protein
VERRADGVLRVDERRERRPRLVVPRAGRGFATGVLSRSDDLEILMP